MNKRQLQTCRVRLAYAFATLLACLMIANAVPVLAADFVVVAHPGVPGGSLSKEDVKAIFLGDKTTWSDGKPIKIVVLEEGAAHKAFLQEVVGKTPAQFDSYWKKLVFTGKAAAPKSFSDAGQLVDYVSKQAGTIGYAESGAAGSSVKTLKVE
jgi:ABC-type phosphate transport system substrate-binding protein